MGDLVFELTVLGLTIFLYAVAVTSDMPNPVSIMRPYWWPKIILSIILVICLVLLYWALKEFKAVKGSKKEAEAKVWPWLLAHIVSITALVALQNVLGFLASSFLFGIVSCFIIEGRFRLMHLLVSLVTTLCLTLFFGSVMGVVLPRGLGIFRDLSFYLY